MLYYGAEYCPYCAAERWAMAAHSSRFGTWSGLKITASSHTDVDPETHTFSFYGATLTSPYINFVPIETYSNIPLARPAATRPCSSRPRRSPSAISTYSSSKFVPSTRTGCRLPLRRHRQQGASSPAASYDPGILAGLTWSEIAGGLNDPTNPATQAIVATANYISAADLRGQLERPGIGV